MLSALSLSTHCLSAGKTIGRIIQTGVSIWRLKQYSETTANLLPVYSITNKKQICKTKIK